MKEFIKKHKIAAIAVLGILAAIIIVVAVVLFSKKTTESSKELIDKETTENGEDDDDYITTGEWIVLYAEKFGLNEYVEEEPYFDNVATDDTFFGYVQTMAEYEIIDRTSELKLDEKISPETVLFQLAKIYGDTYIGNRFEKKELEMADYIKFATQSIGISFDEGATGLTKEEAVSIIDKTWEHYLTKEYDDIEEIAYKDNVMDFTTCKDYVLQQNTLFMSSEEEITEGKVIILTAQDEYQNLLAYKVTEVDRVDNNYELEVTEPEIDDILSYMNIEFSELVNLDSFIPADGVKVVDTVTVASGFNNDQKGTVKTLEVNITDNKLKISPEWEAINAKINISESKLYNKNYLFGKAGKVHKKFEGGYEVVGKVAIKDLILNGNVEYDKKMAFDFNVGATVQFSLSLKGNIKGERVKIGEITVKKPLSPVSFVIDFYLYVDFEGEIKVEPKITAISTVKKIKNSGITATGNVTTDSKAEFNASLSLEAVPDAVLVLFGADIADAYLKIGAKAETTFDPDKIAVNIYLPTLKVGVGHNKNTVLSCIGISGESNVVDKSGATFKCPFVYTLEYNIYKDKEEEKPTEAPTQKPMEPPTTEAPTQKPTEPPITEAPTQKPTEPPTTEAPTQKPTEPVTEAPESGNFLSEKGYEACMYWNGNLYCARENGKWGAVNKDGNVVIPFQYDSVKYANVSKTEIKFIINDETNTYGNLCVVYDTNINKIVEYREFNECVSYDYKDGMYIVVTQLSPIAGAYVVVENAYTGNIIYEGQASYMPLGGDTVEFVSKLDSEPVILLWMPAYNADGYPTYDESTFVKVTPDGYTTEKCNIEYIFMGHMAYYSNGYFTIFDGDGARIQINIDTTEETRVQLDGDCNRDNYLECPARWYFGNGKYFAYAADGINYKIYKSNNVLVNKVYTWCNFQNKDYIIAGNNNSTDIIDYNGNILKTYVDVDPYIFNGKRLVYDGIGVYYIDNTLNKVSDYIVKGNDIAVSGGGIKINGKYHLIKQ